jgi:hypothetical protein
VPVAAKFGSLKSGYTMAEEEFDVEALLEAPYVNGVFNFYCVNEGS